MNERRWRALLWFGLGLAGSFAAACDFDSCGCPDAPERPVAAGVLPIDRTSSNGEGTLTLAPGIDQGTFTLTDSELTISYANEGANYTVTYSIDESVYR